MAPVLAAFIVWLLATGKAKDWLSLALNLEYKPAPSESKSGSSSEKSESGTDWAEMGQEAWQIYRTSQSEGGGSSTGGGQSSGEPSGGWV